MDVQPDRLRSYIVLPLIVLLILLDTAGPGEMPPSHDWSIPLSEVAARVKAGVVRKLTVTNDVVKGEQMDGDPFVSRKEQDISLVTTLLNLGVSPQQLRQVEIEIRPSPDGGTWLLAIFLYGGLFGLILYLLGVTGEEPDSSAMRLFHGDGARVHIRRVSRFSFRDVAGQEEAKATLQETIQFLQSPLRFARLGARMPRGILFTGPPGCGKTLLAKAMAGEARVSFLSVAGSELVEIFAGVGAARIRELFAQARRHAPCILFIDEIDAVGGHRSVAADAGGSEREQTLNQLLVEMDGFESYDSVIVLAATNRPDMLDPALLRPGRFSRRIVVDLPDRDERVAILALCTRWKPLAFDVDLGDIARQTFRFSGADLENMVNEAAILAVRRHRLTIGREEFQEAIEKVRSGPERQSRLPSLSERQVLAYHEAGHALVCTLLPGCDPVERVSLVPRNGRMSYTLWLPESEQSLRTRAELKGELAALLAGQVAETLTLGRMTTTTYAADDLAQATRLARDMVTQLGMSDVLGPIAYGQRAKLDFLHTGLEECDYGKTTARLIDSEVMRLLDEAHCQAQVLLTEHRSALERLARRLLEVETLSGAEVIALIDTETASRPIQRRPRHFDVTKAKQHNSSLHLHPVHKTGSSPA